MLQNQTPEEAWSGIKPDVKHFKIFGCIGHVRIPEAKRTKLDDKSCKCVFIGVSEESKAYRMYNLNLKKIMVSRDVMFEETENWDWGRIEESADNQTNILSWENDGDNHLGEEEYLQNDDTADDEINAPEAKEVTEETTAETVNVEPNTHAEYVCLIMMWTSKACIRLSALSSIILP